MTLDVLSLQTRSSLPIIFLTTHVGLHRWFIFANRDTCCVIWSHEYLLLYSVYYVDINIASLRQPYNFSYHFDCKTDLIADLLIAFNLFMQCLPITIDVGPTTRSFWMMSSTSDLNKRGLPERYIFSMFIVSYLNHVFSLIQYRGQAFISYVSAGILRVT